MNTVIEYRQIRYRYSKQPQYMYRFCYLESQKYDWLEGKVRVYLTHDLTHNKGVDYFNLV